MWDVKDIRLEKRIDKLEKICTALLERVESAEQEISLLMQQKKDGGKDAQSKDW